MLSKVATHEPESLPPKISRKHKVIPPSGTYGKLTIFLFVNKNPSYCLQHLKSI